MKTVVSLGDRRLVIVGTAHVSEKSVQEVEETINTENPDCICVELDEARYATISQEQEWRNLDIGKVLKQKKVVLMITNLVLHSFQRRLGKDIGVKPGAEMTAAIEMANSMGVPVELCDRDIQITFRRAWRRSGFWSRLKLLSALLASVFSTEKLGPEQVEKLKEIGTLHSMLDELSEYLPKVKNVLIDERDQYLSARIFNSSGARIVAVVGLGHVEGIKRWLASYEQKGIKASETDHLNQVPRRSIVSKMAPWSLPAVFVGLVGYGFLNAGAEMTIEKLLQWVLVNGSLAALGALVALGHPLTIICSFIAAPITSVNPMIGVGIVAGLVQAMIRKPRVSDFESLSMDITSLRGVLKNRVTHVLVVFMLSSIGSAVGTFIGFSFLTSLLRGGI